MSHPFKSRDIACARCFRLKRKCDHAKPTCGECRRKGAECLPARSRKSGDSITVPVAYLKDLERRVAELEGSNSEKNSTVELCDAGVQTDLVETDSNMLDIAPIAQSTLWATGPEEGQALVLSSEMQPQSHSSRLSPFSPSLFTDAFFQLNDESLDFFRLDRRPTPPLVGENSIWLTELYTNIYFSISHREWPFLNESAWKKWHREEGITGQEEWRFFFLRMVYAIGASLCSTIHRDTAHLTRSKELYDSAMNYYPHVVGHPSMVLQVQASLLLIVYALHSPSSEEMAMTVSSILPFCTAAITHLRKNARVDRDDEAAAASGEVMSENMFIACYMLNEVIASGWDRPVSSSYRIVDDDVRNLRSWYTFSVFLTDHYPALHSRRHNSTTRQRKPRLRSSVQITKDPEQYKKITREITLAILGRERRFQLVSQVGSGYLAKGYTPLRNLECFLWVLPSELDDQAVRL